MLTKRQNMLETLRGGKPDRYVKGYEALSLVLTPFMTANRGVVKGGATYRQRVGRHHQLPRKCPRPVPRAR